MWGVLISGIILYINYNIIIAVTLDGILIKDESSYLGCLYSRVLLYQRIKHEPYVHYNDNRISIAMG